METRTEKNSKNTGAKHAKGANAEENKKQSKKSRAISWVICIVLAVAAALCVRSFVAEPVNVEGDSMNPSLFSHQTMLVEKVSNVYELPARGNVVIVHYPGSESNYVKRVIALPGEKVEIKDSTVYINDEPLFEDYTSGDEYADMQAVVVPENSIFVMGDNRANSQDSRMVGSIPRERIVGVATMIIWPFDQVHSLP